MRPVFLRGMGWSPWHAKYGWNRPPGVVDQDFAILRDLHVNALRTWGPVTRKTCDAMWERRLYVVPQLRRGKVPRMRFKDGKEGHPAYTHPDALADIHRHGLQLAEALKGHPAVAAFNLGNEYSWVGTNKSGNYEHLGFDDWTLKTFQNVLRKRFRSIDHWNRRTGRKDSSFEAIVPPAGAVNDLLYWEWWRFQRRAFGNFLKEGHDGVREADPATPATYALLCGGRWDAATEDADLSFLEIQGDNLYYHWDRDWGRYSVRLARRIGPGRPILITETGINTWAFKAPKEADRLMRQMLWVLALHPEVRGIFPFVYCDEWWHGPDPKALDVLADAWGIVTADRKPKSTYASVRDTYAEFERLDRFMSTRQSRVELLVTDQVIDRWRGRAGPAVDNVCRALYRHGVSFRLVSLLKPEDLTATNCKRLLLLDSTIPDDPDGSSPAREVLAAFARRGGHILYLNRKPWRGLYLPDGHPRKIKATVMAGKSDGWGAIEPFLGARKIAVESDGGEIFWRKLDGAGGAYLLLIAVGSAPIDQVHLRGLRVRAMVSSDGARLEQSGRNSRLVGLNTYALLRL